MNRCTTWVSRAALLSVLLAIPSISTAQADASEVTTHATQSVGEQPATGTLSHGNTDNWAWD